MSAALSADQIRTGMAECLRALRERLSEGEAADEQLANLITTYIDEQFKDHVNKVADHVDQAVRDCVDDALKKSLLQITGVSQTAEFVTNAAAVAAVKSVPLKVVMGDNADFCFPEIANQSIGETVVLVCKEHLKLKAELAKANAYCQSLRALLNELVQVVSNDGGEVKVFTASEAMDPNAIFARRKDIEKSVTIAPLTPEEKQTLLVCKSSEEWERVVYRIKQSRGPADPSDWVDWLKTTSAMLAGREWIGKELSWYPALSKPLQVEEIYTLMSAGSDGEWKIAVDVIKHTRGGRLPSNWHNWLKMMSKEPVQWTEHPWILKELVDYDLKIATEKGMKNGAGSSVD
jgi:hypothetical protein